MNIDDLTLGQIKEIKGLLGSAKRKRRQHPAVGKYCVIRTYSAGVHCGVVVTANGLEVELRDARRICSWQSDGVKRWTLHEVAMHGVAASSKVSCVVPYVFLTEAIEILPTSGESESNLRGAAWAQ